MFNWGNKPEQSEVPTKEAVDPNITGDKDNIPENPPVEDVDKLDLASLFKDESSKEGVPTEMPSVSQLMTPEFLKQVAGRYNFGNMIPKELQGQLGEIYEPMKQFMNIMGQGVYAAALKDISMVNDGLLGQYHEYSSHQTQDSMKKTIDESKFLDDPALSNPVVRGLITGAMSKAKAQHPDYSIAQQQKLAKRWILEAAGIIEPKKPVGKGKGGQETAESNTGWSNFFGDDSKVA